MANYEYLYSVVLSVLDENCRTSKIKRRVVTQVLARKLRFDKKIIEEVLNEMAKKEYIRQNKAFIVIK